MMSHSHTLGERGGALTFCDKMKHRGSNKAKKCDIYESIQVQFYQINGWGSRVKDLHNEIVTMPIIMHIFTFTLKNVAYRRVGAYAFNLTSGINL